MNLLIKKKIKKYLRKLNIEASHFKYIPHEVQNALQDEVSPTQLASFLQELQQKGAPEWFEYTHRVTSKELFQYQGKDLPCKLQEDYNPADDWLNDPSYYPLYYNLFKSYSKDKQKINFLEIGVRTGYIPAVFAQAVEGPSHYVGIDPNLYLPNGLDLAAETCKIMATANPLFHYMLINGYSWNDKIIKTLELSPRYDIIHIDGDHTRVGKLSDLFIAAGLLKENGIVIVDDFLHHSFIQGSVFTALQKGWYKKAHFIESFRGMAILQ